MYSSFVLALSILAQKCVYLGALFKHEKLKSWFLFIGVLWFHFVYSSGMPNEKYLAII